MFTRLRTRLTVLYAALFGATLVLISLGVYAAISGSAQQQVRSELQASGTVFDRLWSVRAEQLRDGAALLARDFGFREAVATNDAATIQSAMDNLRRRFGIDRAFIVGLDGRVIGQAAPAERAEATHLAEAFSNADDPSGVIVLAGQAYQVTAAPLLSPDLMGWVVFAVRLDAREMSALEQLSSIPLKAVVLHKERTGWRAQAGVEAGDRAALSRFIEEMLAARRTTPRTLDQHDGRAIALVKPLPTLAPDQAATLVLSYPLSRALAPFQPLLAIVAAIGLVGVAVVGWGSWVLARGITRPLSALDEAAHRLQRGEDAHVQAETNDEIGRLAESFNTMATAIRDRERRITHLALHDGETGLPNRLAFERVVESLSDRPAGQVYVAALGIQRFDQVRGAIGYALAAQAVRMIGNRIGGLAPASGVARLSTDVLGFALVAAGPQAAADDAARLMSRLEQPLKVGGAAMDVALHLGLAPLGAGQSPDNAIELANIALDQARHDRRKVAFFDAEAYGDPASNLSLMSDMLRGLEAGEMALHYQPKFDLRRRGVTGAEALIRWKHPVRGALAPDLFIPMAEETGHIRTLTEWVVRQALGDIEVLREAGFDLELAVNLSGRTLGEPDFGDFARAQTAGRSGLCFEITETAVIENPDLALGMLDTFAQAGISVAIDDFGSGLSSLAYLKQIRAQELKIDKAIVQGVTDSQRDALIVRSTIDLAHSLGLKVTAEGVETNACFSLLAAMGCDQAQGYLVAKPMPLKELLTFLREDHGQDRSYG